MSELAGPSIEALAAEAVTRAAAAPAPPARVPERVFDRLWPVLTGLGLLLAGAIVLEIVATNRVAAGRVVVIGAASAQVTASSDDDGDAEGTEIATDGPPVDAAHAQARLLARRGMTDPAIAAYDQVAAAHPEVAAVHAELGYWLLAANREARAQAALEKAAALAPDDPFVVLNLGIAHSRQGDLVGAETLYRRAKGLRASFGAADLALGMVLLRRQRAADAIAVLEPAASRGSNDLRARVLVQLGRAYLASKRRDDAARVFEQAIEFAPAAIEIRLSVGRAWLATGKEDDTTRALELLARATELAPDVPAVWATVARAKERKKDVAGAEASYERALRLDPDFAYARRRLLRLALDRQDFPRARLMAEYLLTRSGEVPEHHFLAGLVAARDDKKDDARGHYRDAISKAGGNYPEAFFNLALLEKGDGHLDLAIAAYQQAIALRPTYQQAYNNLGLALGAAGRPDEAVAAFQRAIAIDGNYATAWLNLGELELGRDRHDAAIAAFKKAIAARASYPQARLDLAVALGRAGQRAQAIATYRELVATEPRYVAGWHNLGLALEDAHDDGGAVDAWQRALAVDPERTSTRSRLAGAYARLGRHDEAVALWRDVLDTDPADRDARLGLAAEAQRRGDRATCASEARAVLATHPGSAPATQLLSTCTAP